MSLDELQKLLGVLSAPVIGVVLAAVWKYGWKPARARAVARRELDLRRNAAVDLIHELAPTIKRMAVEVLPNGGSSISDKVNRIHAQLDYMDRRSDQAMSSLKIAGARTDKVGDLIYVSRALQRQAGRTADEMLGRGWLNCVDPIERPRVRKDVFEAVADHRDFDTLFAWRVPARGGDRIVAVKLTGWPLRDPSKNYDGHVLTFQETEDAVYQPTARMPDVPEDEEE